MEKKTPFSTQIYTLAALALTAIAAVLLVIAAFLYFAAFDYIFWIIAAVFALAGIFFGIKERLRGKYPYSTLSIILGLCDIIAIIVFIILKA